MGIEHEASVAAACAACSRADVPIVRLSKLYAPRHVLLCESCLGGMEMERAPEADQRARATLLIKAAESEDEVWRVGPSILRLRAAAFHPAA